MDAAERPAIKAVPEHPADQALERPAGRGSAREKEPLDWAAREGERKQAAIVTRDATRDAGGDTGREALARRTFWVIVAAFGVSSASLALSLVVLCWG
jgi:hypothetical protein